MITTPTEKKTLLLLFKDFYSRHTVTSVAKGLAVSRVGAWKALGKLEKKGYVALDKIGSGKTSAAAARINWGNQLVEKALALYLAEEAAKQKRWSFNFSGLEGIAKFSILCGSVLHSAAQARDIDIINVASRGRLAKARAALEKAQSSQEKKIHSLNFTEAEFKEELERPNPALVDAVRKGVALFGQENFVRFIKGVRI